MHPSIEAIAHSRSLPIAEFPMMNRDLSRPGVMGLNANVSVGGEVFHIQTEDLGPKCPQIVSHVFAEGGQVVKVVRFDYAHHVGKYNLQLLLPKVLMAHHTNIVTKVKRGALSEDSFGISRSQSWDTEGMKSERSNAQACLLLPMPDAPNYIDAAVSAGTSDVESRDELEVSSCHGVRSSSSVAPISRSAREIWDYLSAKAQCERTASDSASSVAGAPPVGGASRRPLTVNASVHSEVEQSPSARWRWDRAVLARHQSAALERARRPDKTDAGGSRISSVDWRRRLTGAARTQ